VAHPAVHRTGGSLAPVALPAGQGKAMALLIQMLVILGRGCSEIADISRRHRPSGLGASVSQLVFHSLIRCQGFVGTAVETTMLSRGE